jgi:hypothetical protein
MRAWLRIRNGIPAFAGTALSVLHEEVAPLQELTAILIPPVPTPPFSV